ncbi:MAG: DUF4870 domain-containing protein [Anaerolineales bacterium]|jgi:uncharacterized Tic20 family protein
MQTDSGAPLPSQDERIAGALAHIGALIPAICLWIPILIWITQKDRSRFSGFQALQAAAFQLILILATCLAWSCFIGSIFVSFVPLTLNNNSPAWVVDLPLLISSSVLFLWGLAWLILDLYAILAAVLTFQGRDFCYLIVGPLVDGFLHR